VWSTVLSANDVDHENVEPNVVEGTTTDPSTQICTVLTFVGSAE
jgi:hypothetical protein